MLRITTHDKPGSLTFQLEGRLAGPWVQELEQCWRGTVAGRDSSTVRVDLAGVTSIDASGRELLRAMYACGTKLVAADCWTKAIVAEIARSPAVHSHRPCSRPAEMEE